MNTNFDDLSLSPESYWNGPDPNGEIVEGMHGPEVLGQFSSQGVRFVNRYDLTYGSWRGFSYSNASDTTTVGHANQFSASTGDGLGAGSDNYGVAFGYLDLEPNLFQDFAFDPNNPQHLEQLPTLEIPPGARAMGLYATNTTYAMLSMRQGDSFAKQFGGPGGDDPDWFKLNVFGTDSAGEPLIETVEFYLADYRFSDSHQDYIVNQWSFIDLSVLGDAQQLHFNLSSSDAGLYGLNTPAYFAIDDIETVAAGLPGDFDSDDDVDGFDFLYWQRKYQSQTTPYFDGDYNGDGMIHQVELAIWEDNYGTVAPLTPQSTASLVVPEPASWISLSVLVLLLDRRQRRR